MACVGIRLAEQRDEVGAGAVGDVRLAAVDDVVAADLLRRRAQARDVGAGARLAHTERRDLVAGERGREELGLLFRGAEVVDARRRHVALHEQAHAHAGRADAHELFALRDAEPVIAAAAADVFGVVRPENPELARALEHPVRKELVLLPLVRVRGELLVDELTDLLAEEVVLLGERRGDGHGLCAPSRVGGLREVRAAVTEWRFMYRSVPATASVARCIDAPCAV